MKRAKHDPYQLPTEPEDGVMYGEIHDATKCCIPGWGCYVASICRGPGKRDMDALFQNGRYTVNEEGFERHDAPGRVEAYARSLKWLKKMAKARGLKLKLYVKPPDGHAGKVKLVSA